MSQREVMNAFDTRSPPPPKPPERKWYARKVSTTHTLPSLQRRVAGIEHTEGVQDIDDTGYWQAALVVEWAVRFAVVHMTSIFRYAFFLPATPPPPFFLVG